MGDDEPQRLQAHDGLFLTQQEILLQKLYDDIAKLHTSADTSAHNEPLTVATPLAPATPHAPTSVSPGVHSNLSAIERVKAVMAAKAKQQTSQMSKAALKTAPVKRTNPLADLLKPSASGAAAPLKRARMAAPPAAEPGNVINTVTGEMRLGNGRGIQLPPESFLRTDEWASHRDEPLAVTLPAVVFRTNNTLVVNGTIPSSSCRFVLNLATTDGTIVCHLNPRKMRGGQILLNSFVEGRWGTAHIVQRCPLIFGSPTPFRFMLRITITPSGFALFVDEVFVDEFKHQIPLREGDDLVLNVPTKDEYGNPEVVVLHNVWWGHTDMAATPARPPPRYNMPGPDMRMPHNNQFDVYVGNLPSEANRSDLARLFADFTYDYIRITQRGFGFVALKNAADVDRAVRDLDGVVLPGFTAHLKISAALTKRT
ncbi:hypothetical protein SPRG_11661 [Saprolegnia parasitica CBS 223.65]|uniref:Galectin n=1 Tax=Saprolegnia parasitica (strain CBS 223.65) TaxID=695850 RepID=A0A067BYK2_SAPPC|nr:hypothetical protein SPRG_11661 [Saprolegnia parasitica CBS 223.65]KDO23348.1 hypothetical protein SPRG_11661 [Saprolegnia parasitica CBS 223.65]|eukprot:XP_012205997.1 hypothetical protein SPRG_11661 [Saprolegnia parasitica CBS 223.65]